MWKTLAFVLFLLSSSCIQAPTSDDQQGSWNETCEPFSKIDFTATTTVPVFVKDTGGTNNLLMRIPSQVYICCDTTTTGCWATWTMDPGSASIDQLVDGVFAADDDSFYSAGRGKTTWIGSGACEYTGVRSTRNFFDNGLPRAGARKKTCSSTQQPCAANGECTTGTCDTFQKPATSYLVVESEAGLGRVTGHVCEG